MVCTLAALVSCQCNRDKTTTTFEDNVEFKIDSMNMAEDLNKSKAILYTLPAPIEMASLIKESNVKYDESMLNDLNKSSQYNSNMKMALNVGIYTTDMSIANMFNQSQKTVEYFNVLQNITKRLGIVKLIDEATFQKLEEKGTSKDDILNIISEVYMNANQYLTENNRKNIATMVLTGGWTEGLYLALNLMGTKPNKQLTDRIIAQKLSLSTIINIIEQTNKDKQDEDLNYIMNKMLEIKMYFDEVKIEVNGKIEATTDPTTKTTKISANCNNEISQDILNLLKDKVNEIRNEFIN